MTADNTTAYVKRGNNTHKETYHDGPNSCQNAKQVDNWEQTTREAAEKRGLRRCMHCKGEHNPGAYDRSYLNALKEAAADD